MVYFLYIIVLSGDNKKGKHVRYCVTIISRFRMSTRKKHVTDQSHSKTSWHHHNPPKIFGTALGCPN